MADQVEINGNSELDTSNVSKVDLNSNINVNVKVTSNAQNEKKNENQKPPTPPVETAKKEPTGLTDILNSISNSLESLKNTAIAVKDELTGGTEVESAATPVSPLKGLDDLTGRPLVKTNVKDILVNAFISAAENAEIQAKLKAIAEAININSTVINDKEKAETSSNATTSTSNASNAVDAVNTQSSKTNDQSSTVDLADKVKDMQTQQNAQIGVNTATGNAEIDSLSEMLKNEANVMNALNETLKVYNVSLQLPAASPETEKEIQDVNIASVNENASIGTSKVKDIIDESRSMMKNIEKDSEVQDVDTSNIDKVIEDKTANKTIETSSATPPPLPKVSSVVIKKEKPHSLWKSLISRFSKSEEKQQELSGGQQKRLIANKSEEVEKEPKTSNKSVKVIDATPAVMIRSIAEKDKETKTGILAKLASPFKFFGFEKSAKKETPKESTEKDILKTKENINTSKKSFFERFSFKNLFSSKKDVNKLSKSGVDQKTKEFSLTKLFSNSIGKAGSSTTAVLIKISTILLGILAILKLSFANSKKKALYEAYYGKKSGTIIGKISKVASLFTPIGIIKQIAAIPKKIMEIFFGAIKKFIKKITLGLLAIGALIFIYFKSETIRKKVNSALGTVFSFIWDTAKKLFSGLKSKALVIGLSVLTGILSFFGGPIGLLIGLITSLIVTSSKFQDAIRPVWENIKELLSNVCDFVVAIWHKVKAIWDIVASVMKYIFSLNSSTIKFIGKFINAVKAESIAFYETLKGVVNITTSIGKALKDTFGNIFESAWNSLKNIGNMIMSVISILFNGILDNVKNEINYLKDCVSVVFSNTINSVLRAITDILPDWAAKSLGINPGKLRCQ